MPEVLVEPRFESPTAAPTAAAAATPTATTTATPTATTSTMAAAVLRLPGRAAEIAAYGALLGQRESTVPAIFVYGHTATGKTLVVKSVLRHHNVRHAYVSCVDKYTLRLLFEAVLDQLFGHVPSQADGFTSRVRCDNLSDFVSLLVEAIDTVPAEQRSSSLPAASSGQVHQPTVHLVFDNAERLRDFSTATLLPALLRLRELTMRNICVTLISELVWDKFRAGTGAPDPYVMYFAPYSQAVSVEIIAAERPALQVPSELFQEFIKLLWNVFHGPCRDLNELRHLAQLLFPVYCEPVLQGTVESSDSVRLWRHIDPYFRKVLAKLYLREISDSEWGRVQQQAHEFAASGTSSASIVAGGVAVQRLDIELPYHSKFLLIAAYLASYNSVRSDSTVFAKRTRDTPLRRRGRGGKLASTPRTEKLSQRLLGPRPFPLDRLFAIFHSIVDERVDSTADLQMQVSSLISLRLLTRHSAADNLDAVKLRCNVSWDFALAVARSVSFDLSRYLTEV